MQKKKEFNYITFVADDVKELKRYIESPNFGEKVIKAKVRIASLENHKTMKIFDLQPYVNVKNPQSYFLSTLDVFGIVKRDLVAFREEMKEFDYEYTLINTKRLVKVERKGESLEFSFETGKGFSLVFSEFDLKNIKEDDKKVFYSEIDAKVFTLLKQKMSEEEYKNIYKGYILNSRM